MNIENISFFCSVDNVRLIELRIPAEVLLISNLQKKKFPLKHWKSTFKLKLLQNIQTSWSSGIG